MEKKEQNGKEGTKGTETEEAVHGPRGEKCSHGRCPA